MKSRILCLTSMMIFLICLVYTSTSNGQQNEISPGTTPIQVKTYNVSSSAGDGGSISPSGEVKVKNGSDQTFTITPDPCYYISGIAIDSVSTAVTDRLSAGTESSYTFTDVTSDHTISAAFQLKTYTIRATATSEALEISNDAASQAHGSIAPSGIVTVDCGTDQTFAITPDKGYQVKDVLVDGSSEGAITSYTFTNVTADHKITAIFEVDATPAFHTIRASAGTGGSISPSGMVRVRHGDDQNFIITPDLCYDISEVIVDGLLVNVDNSSVNTGISYTIRNVTSDHTISVIFEKKNYTIRAGAIDIAESGEISLDTEARGHGSISPSGVVTVVCGEDQEFAITPDEGYYLRTLLVDGSSIEPKGSYTFVDVTSDHTIYAVFAVKTYTIRASASDGGNISPSGEIEVKHGSDQTFIITPDSCYYISDVTVDGLAVGSDSSYSFTNITSDHTISAAFERAVYTIVATASDLAGNISPSGTVEVDCGGDQEFTIAPDEGYHVKDVLVDGLSAGAVAAYTFANVTSGHTIHAVFEINTYVIEASAGSGGSILPSGSVIVNHGASMELTITPDGDYRIEDVIIDGLSVGAKTSYTFLNIESDHTIEARFGQVLPEIAEVRNDTDGKPQKSGDVITVIVIQSGNSIPIDMGRFDIGHRVMDQPLYNDGTHGDLLSGDNIWTGQYTVREGDDIKDALVTARLYASDEVMEKSGDDRITIDTIPPGISSLIVEPDPAGVGDIDITVTFDEDGSGMDESVSLNVSFITPGGETAGISGSYTGENIWSGKGEILKSYRDGRGTLIAHGGKDRAGNALSPPEMSVGFWIDIIEEIEWARHYAVGTLKIGDVIKVWMKGEEEREASFDITGVVSGVYMAETDPGTYEGSYLIQEGDDAVGAWIICHLGDVQEMADPSIAIDTAKPRVESISTEPELATAENITITVIFSEEIDMNAQLSVVFIPNGTGKSIPVNGAYEDDSTWRGEGVITADLENGPAKIAISGAQDAAGNLMELHEKREAFTIDTVPPDNSQARVFINDGAEFADDRALKITWNGFDDEHGIDGYYYSLTNGSGTSNGNYTKTSNGTLTATGDDAIIYVWAKDEVGNIGTAAHSSIIIDTEPPIVEKVVIPEIIKAGNLTVSVQFQDDISGLSEDPSVIQVEIRLNNGLTGIRFEMESYSADGLWTGRGTAIDNINDDSGVLVISGARDKAGNKMTPDMDHRVIIDTQLPPPPENFTAIPGLDGVVKFNWQSSAASDVQNYRIYQTSPDEKLLADNIPGISTEHDIKMADGLYRFGISAVDEAGNEGTRSFSPFVEADGISPEDVTDLASESMPWSKIKLSWTPSASSDNIRYEITYNGKTVSTEETVWISESLEDGRLYTFNVVALDEVGNRSDGISINERAINNEEPTVEIRKVEKSGSRFSIEYRLHDRENEGLNIICEYRRPGSGEWRSATVDGETENITDYDGEINWNSRLDIASASGENVRFRITPEDSDQKGDPHETELEITNILGDYDDDGKVDYADLSIFQNAWNEQEISKELGPATGEPPDMVPHPDGVIDFEDLVVFGLMWKWSSGGSSNAPIQWAIEAEKSVIRMEPPVLEAQDDNILNISIPTDSLMGNVYIEYNSKAIDVSSVKPSSRSDTVFLSDTAQPGRVVLAFVDPVSHSDENKVFTMTLGWKTDAEDAEVSCFYEIRDSQNRKLTSGIQSSTIDRLPRACALLQNYPNPCNPGTWIPFRLAEDSDVVIRIYNSTGRLIRTLDLGSRKAGFHTSLGKAAYWDGRSEDGEELGSDVYFYSIEAGTFTRVRKMIVLR